MGARSTSRSNRPVIGIGLGFTLIASIGGIVGYFLPTGFYNLVMTALSQLGAPVKASFSASLAGAVVMYLLGAVVYYGIFILSMRLLQSYGFLKTLKDLHHQAHFLVFGYILLVVFDIALAQTPGSIHAATWYALFLATLHGLLYAAVAGLTNAKHAKA